MSNQIIGFQHWLASPAGQYFLSWEKAQFPEAVADIFGYHALQCGVPELYALQTSRIPHRWVGTPAIWIPSDHQSAHASNVLLDYAALPFAPASLDLVVLAHSLECSADPHGVLREAERVLLPEGRLIIGGINPASFFGMRQSRERLWRKFGGSVAHGLPLDMELMGYWRLRDWLRLLGFEVEIAKFGCYAPAFDSVKWLKRFAWIEKLGERWWPILGGCYFLVAVKRVRNMHIHSPNWKAQTLRHRKSVPLAQKR